MSEDVATLMMVTYNRLDLTKRMLLGPKGLFFTVNRPFNLVIVDNGSTDGTVDYLDEMLAMHTWDKEELAKRNMTVFDTLSYPYMHKLVIHKNKKNRGIGIGRNQTLKLADELDTDFYCTIDNDVEVPKGWLQECIDILKANKRYGAIGVNMEGKPYPLVTEGGKTFQRKPQGNLGTACMAFPKSLHKMLGFFNTEYGVYGEEDADWGMRARVVGYNLGYIERMGNHFGDGELDTGEYREFKTACHKRNLAKFNQNCAAYYQRKKPIFIKYKE